MSEDGKDTAGNVETANLDVSKEQDSITVADTKKQIQDLQKTVDALVRSMQSEKDKGIANTNKRIDGLEKNLKEALRVAQQKGQSIQDLLGEVEAQEQADTQQALAELAQAFRSGQFSGRQALGGADNTGVDVTNVLRELELDENDMRVKEFRSRQFKSNEEAYREGAKLLKTITTKQPTQASAPSPQGGLGQSPNQQEALKQEYDERSKNLRGTALIQLKMEMRKKGLRSIS